MAVRSFNGSSDLINCAIGALSGCTYGTAAAIVRVNANSTDQEICGLHNSGGTWQAVMLQVGSANDLLWHDGAQASSTGTALTNSTWYLLLARKASGTVAPRFSVYNYTTTTWTHTAGTNTLVNHTAPGAGGTIRLNFQDAGDWYAGYVAARAVWANTLPWTADAAGDTAIQSAGLHTAAANWLAANPSAFWLFNQASTGVAVTDLSTAGTASQSSITGTTVINGSDPPGFSFALAAPVVGLQAAQSFPPFGPRGPRYPRALPFQLLGDTAPTAPPTAAEGGVGALALAGTGTPRKIAVQGGACAVGAAGTAAGQKVAVARGAATVGLAGAGAERKVAPQAGAAAVGLAGVGTDAQQIAATIDSNQARPLTAPMFFNPARAATQLAGDTQSQASTPSAAETGTGTLGLAAIGAHRKVAAVTGSCALGLAGAGTEQKVAKSGGLASFGVAGTATPRKVAVEQGAATLGLTGTRSGTASRAVSGTCTVGLAGAGAERKVAPQAGAATLGLAGVGTEQKVAKSGGVSTIGLAATRSGVTARPVTGTCALGLSATGTPRKAATPTGAATVGCATTGLQRKRGTPTGAACLGLAPTSVQSRRSRVLGSTTLGLAGSGRAAKRTGGGGVATLGLTAAGATIPIAPDVAYPLRAGPPTDNTARYGSGVPGDNRALLLAGEPT